MEITIKSGASVTLGTGTFALVMDIAIAGDDVGSHPVTLSGIVIPSDSLPSTPLVVTIVTIDDDDLGIADVDDLFDVLIKNLTSTTCDADMDLDSTDGYEVVDWAFTKL